MHLVSVIIPSYNPQNFLVDAINSAFNQTYKNIEVILVNDGSSDEYKQFYTEIAQTHPSLNIISQQNKGVAAARNLGAKEATGEYLSFLDQDDIWNANKLELQSKYLNEHPEIAYVTSRQRYFLSEDVSAPPAWVKPEHINTSLPGFLPGTLMVRASVFHQLNGFDENLKAGTDDVDLFFRANNTGLKTFQLSEELLLKRIHSTNLSAKTLSHNKELLSVVRMNMMRKKQET